MDVNENETIDEESNNESDSDSDSESESEFNANNLEMLAAKVSAKKGYKNAVIDLLKDAMAKEHFNAVLLPHEVPAGDSFVYLLIQDPNVLSDASPFTPIMPVQGARALSSVTHLGTNGLKLAAFMRPCETRAAIELSKSDQDMLDDVTLISYDCPGVLASKVFDEDPKKGSEMFDRAMKECSRDVMRPMCRICEKCNEVYGDLHIGRSGIDNGSMLLIQKTKKGEAFLSALGIKPEDSVEAWQKKTEELTLNHQKARNVAFAELKNKKLGLDNLLDAFSTCLKCLNCMRVCPVDNCHQCYFESDVMRYSPEEYFARAQNNGSLRFPTDTLHYHLGRILHMSMSCVSCGTCEDACPMSIPVAQIYNVVATEVQELFGYSPGSDINEPRPLTIFETEEFAELES
jgi:formate dehydrogenase subunit beta